LEGRFRLVPASVPPSLKERRGPGFFH